MQSAKSAERNDVYSENYMQYMLESVGTIKYFSVKLSVVDTKYFSFKG